MKYWFIATSCLTIIMLSGWGWLRFDQSLMPVSPQFIVVAPGLTATPTPGWASMTVERMPVIPLQEPLAPMPVITPSIPVERMPLLVPSSMPPPASPSSSATPTPHLPMLPIAQPK